MMIEALQAEIEELTGGISQLQSELKSLESPVLVGTGAGLAEATAAHFESAEPRKRAVQQTLQLFQERLKAKQRELHQAQENERQTRLQSEIDAKVKEAGTLTEEINFLAEKLAQSVEKSLGVNAKLRTLWQEKQGFPHHNPPQMPKSTRDPFTGREIHPFTLPQATARDSGIFLDQKPLSFN